MSLPTVSVVVASHPAGCLDRCLDSLAAQGAECAEVLVVHAGPDSVTAPPFARIETAPAGTLVPALWAQGMRQAHGDVVAITTSQFVPASDWVACIRAAHARHPGAAIGGALLLPADARATDAAVFLQRYGPYLSLNEETEVADLAGDNASYKRVALERHPRVLAHGFWEQELHELLRAEGEPLVFVPTIRVTQIGSFGFGRFLRQRLTHGRHYGRTRARAWGLARRCAGAAALPAVALVLMRRAVVRARAAGWRTRLWSVLPALACFVTAWSVGEALGYVSPRTDAR